jgi:hypothetical protein
MTKNSYDLLVSHALMRNGNDVHSTEIGKAGEDDPRHKDNSGSSIDQSTILGEEFGCDTLFLPYFTDCGPFRPQHCSGMYHGKQDYGSDKGKSSAVRPTNDSSTPLMVHHPLFMGDSGDPDQWVNSASKRKDKWAKSGGQVSRS